MTRTGSPFRFPPLAALVLACVATCAKANPDPTAGPHANLLLSLIDPTDEARALDARESFRDALDDPSLLAAVIAALRDDHPPGARSRLPQKLAAVEGYVPPADLVPELGSALALAWQLADQQQITPLLGLLSRRPSRDAVAVLMDRLAQSTASSTQRASDPALRNAVLDALSAQTGLTFPDPASWLDWWAAARWLPEAEWRDQVARAQTLRASRLRSEARAAGLELARTFRRLYALTNEDTRGPLLVEMLAHASADVRRTAFDLMVLALLNARPVPTDAADAAAQRLGDPDPSLRAQAARVVELLARPGDARAIDRALEAETAPEPASALLSAASKRPTAALPFAAERWLDDPLAATSALDALAAAVAADFPLPEHVARAAAESLRRRPDDLLTPASIALLPRLGQSVRAASLLSSPKESVALAAAQGLSRDPAAVDALVSAAKVRVPLVPSALAALERHCATAEGLFEARALARAHDLPERELAVNFARVLPAREVRLALDRVEDPDLRYEILAGVAGRPDFFSNTQETTERIELALELVTSRIARRQFTEALAAVEAFPPASQGPRLLALHITALACLGRSDEAWALTTLPENEDDPTARWAVNAWLNALELSQGESFAADLAAAIAEKLSTVLSPDETKRFERLRSEITTVSTQPASTP